MTPVIPFNRQIRRRLDTRFRSVSGGGSCAPCSGGVTPLQTRPTTLQAILDHDFGGVRAQRYAALTGILGQALSNSLLVDYAKKKTTTTPLIMRRTQTLAAVLGTAITASPQREWYRLLAEQTTQSLSDAVQHVAPRIQGATTEADRFMQALAYVLLVAAMMGQTHEANDVFVGYQRAVANFDALAASAAGTEKLSSSPKKRTSLGGLGKLSDNVSDPDWVRVITTVRSGNYYPSFSLSLINTCGVSETPDAKWERLVHIFGAMIKAGIDIGGPVNWSAKYKNYTGDEANVRRYIDYGKISPDELVYWSQSKWCDEDVLAKKITAARNRRANGVDYVDPDDLGSRTILDNVEAKVTDATTYLVNKTIELAKQSTDLLCRAFRGLFGDGVGGTICSIFRFIFDVIRSITVTTLLIFQALITGLIDFVQNLFRAEWKAAVDSLLGMLTKIIILSAGASTFGTFINTRLGIYVSNAERQQAIDALKAAGGLNGLRRSTLRGFGATTGPAVLQPPSLAPIPTTTAAPITQISDIALIIAGIPPSLEDVANQVAKDDPFFIVNVIISAVAVYYTAGNPTSISSLIVSLAPAVGAIYAAPLKNSFASAFSDMTVAQMKAAIIGIMKIGALVVSKVMTLSDTIKKLWDGIKRYYQKANETEGTLNNLWVAVKNQFVPTLQDLWNDISKGNVKDAWAGLKKLVKWLPEALKGIAYSDPDLKDIYDSVATLVPQIAATINEAKAIWADATKQATQGLSAPDQRAALRAQIDALTSQLKSLCTGVNDAYCNVQTTQTVTTTTGGGVTIPIPTSSGGGSVAPAKTTGGSTTTVTTTTTTNVAPPLLTAGASSPKSLLYAVAAVGALMLLVRD